MNYVIRVTLCVIVPTFFFSIVVPHATAQNSDWNQLGGEGTQGKERERYTSRLTSSGIVLPVVFGDDIVQEDGDLHLRLEQLRDDLNYLEAANRYLVDTACEGDNLNLKTVAKVVAKVAGEIKKRTVRVRNLLALQESEQRKAIRPEAVPAEWAQLKAVIFDLSSFITNALRNPVLQGRILNQEQALAAQRDLDAIVELSARIKTSCRVMIKNER